MFSPRQQPRSRALAYKQACLDSLTDPTIAADAERASMRFLAILCGDIGDRTRATPPTGHRRRAVVAIAAVRDFVILRRGRPRVVIKGNGTQEQFQRIHELVQATSPNFCNITRAVQVVPALIIE